MVLSNTYIIASNGSFISETELYHHGIKGMRWGVRKYQNEDGSLTAAGKKRYAKEVYRNDKRAAKKEYASAVDKATKTYDKAVGKYKQELAKVDDTHDKLQKATDEHYQTELSKYKADMDFWESGDFYEEAANKYNSVMSEYNSASAANRAARSIAKVKVADLYSTKIANATATKEQQCTQAGLEYIQKLKQAKANYKAAKK